MFLIKLGKLTFEYFLIALKEGVAHVKFFSKNFLFNVSGTKLVSN